MPSSSLSQRPWFPGIELAFVCFGAFDPDRSNPEDPNSTVRFEPLSGKWLKIIPPGAHREFTANFSSLDLTFRSVQSLDMSGAFLPLTSQESSGLLSCVIIVKSSQSLISSQYRLSPFESCTVSLSSNTAGGKSSISMLPTIRPVPGLCSNREKCFQILIPSNTPFWIGMQSSGRRLSNC